MRVRGLKFLVLVNIVKLPFVAPHAGAWIEIPSAGEYRKITLVAPHAGAWIEIKKGYG